MVLQRTIFNAARDAKDQRLTCVLLCFLDGNRICLRGSDCLLNSMRSTMQFVQRKESHPRPGRQWKLTWRWADFQYPILRDTHCIVKFCNCHFILTSTVYWFTTVWKFVVVWVWEPVSWLRQSKTSFCTLCRFGVILQLRHILTPFFL